MPAATLPSRTWAQYVLLVFGGSVALRTIPELLAGRYPIGFDVTASYPYSIVTFPTTSIAEQLKWGPLLYGLLWFSDAISKIDLFLLLKLTGPLMFGFFTTSFLVYLRTYHSFSAKKAAVGTLLFAVQPITLRISWDLFRNELGLGMMFLSFTALGSNWKSKNVVAAVFGLLTVLSHPLAGAMLVVGILAIYGAGKLTKRTITYFLPATSLLVASILLMLFVPSPSTRVLLTSSPTGTSSVLSNVFLSDSRFADGSYLRLASYVLVLFVVSFAPLMYFVKKGFFPESSIVAMTLALLVGSFSVLLSPYASIPEYWRWEILLIVPFAVFAANGLDRLGLLQRRRQRAFGLLLVSFIILGLGYSTGAFSYMGLYGVGSYAPGTMVQSSIATSDIDDAFGALRWLNQETPAGSCLFSDQRFVSFALITLSDNTKLIVQPGGPPFHFSDGITAECRPSTTFAIWESAVHIEGFRVLHTENTISIFIRSNR